MLSNMTAVRITAEMVNDKEEEVFLFEVKVAWQLENRLRFVVKVYQQ